MEKLTFTTQESDQVLDITDDISAHLKEQGVGNGVVHLFITHTTAALTTADLDPGTDKDMLDAFNAMIPKLDYRHPHDPSHVGDHIMASIIGPSVSVLIKDGELMLGTWQRVVLVEFDGPRERAVCMHPLTEA